MIRAICKDEIRGIQCGQITHDNASIIPCDSSIITCDNTIITWYY